MIVVRFKVQCQPEKTEQVMAAFEEVIAPSRAVDGVISFDIARDLADPDSFVAIEVFEDRGASSFRSRCRRSGRRSLSSRSPLPPNPRQLSSTSLPLSRGEPDDAPAVRTSRGRRGDMRDRGS